MGRRCTIAPEFVYLKRDFLSACNNSTSYWIGIYFDHQLYLLFSNIYGNYVKQGNQSSYHAMYSKTIYTVDVQ